MVHQFAPEQARVLIVRSPTYGRNTTLSNAASPLGGLNSKLDAGLGARSSCRSWSIRASSTALYRLPTQWVGSGSFAWMSDGEKLGLRQHASRPFALPKSQLTKPQRRSPPLSSSQHHWQILKFFIQNISWRNNQRVARWLFSWFRCRTGRIRASSRAASLQLWISDWVQSQARTVQPRTPLQQAVWRR